jgi:two-component system sensor kinase FixL
MMPGTMPDCRSILPGRATGTSVEHIDLKKSLAADWQATERRLKWIFWPVVIVAEIAFFAVQMVYLATDAISVARFTVNLVIFNVVLLGLLLLVFVGTRRLLLRIYYYENKILTIEDISTDAVFTQDADRRLTSWSKGAERIFGYSEEEAIGSRVGIILPEQEADGEAASAAVLAGGSGLAKVITGDEELAEALARDGLVSQHRTVRRRKGGELFPAEVSTSVLLGPEGEPAGELTVLRDITRQVELEDELLRTNAELKGYAQVVSHDMKAPLATIKLAASTLDVLTKKPANEEVAVQVDQVLETMDNSINQSAALINDLLTLAEAGQKPEEAAPVDVRGIVDEVLDEMAAYISETGTTVNVGGDMGSVVANPTHLHQLFANLISNAIRHNDSPAPVVEVRSLGTVDGAHRLLVRDNGSGVPEADMERIFVPFFKGSRGDTGIGLSTVQKIIGVYGGDIRVFNDGGACFEFTISDFQDENDA